MTVCPLRIPIAAIALFALAGCHTPYRSVPPDASSTSAQPNAAGPGDSWSGAFDAGATPNAPGAPSAPSARSAPLHDVEPRSESRMYLLDLYQQAVDERDALVLELKSVNLALEKEAAARGDVEKERDALIAKVKDLEERAAARDAELSELVARLTTAQIRRLEAEKSLLEAKIEAEKERAAVEAKMTGASALSTKDKKSAPARGKP